MVCKIALAIAVVSSYAKSNCLPIFVYFLCLARAVNDVQEAVYTTGNMHISRIHSTDNVSQSHGNATDGKFLYPKKYVASESNVTGQCYKAISEGYKNGTTRT